MFGSFSEEVRKVLIGAKEEMYLLNHPYVGSEHLILSILRSNCELANQLNSYNLTYDKFKDELIKVVGIGTKKSEWFLYTPLLKRVIENSLIIARDNNSNEVSLYDLFLGLLEEGDGVGLRIIGMLNIDVDLIYDEFLSKTNKKNKRLLVTEFGVDLTSINSDPVIGRDTEIKRILEILARRTKNNPILIGEAGVGKTAIVEELSRLIKNNQVPTSLRNKRIINVDMASLIAGTKYRGEFESRINKIINEVENNDDIILFIDEIHTLVGAGGAEGAIDASNIFKPALARGKLRVIGATTLSEYKKYIEKDGALDRRFQKVLVDETKQGETKNILKGLRTIYEDFHNVKITDEIIDKIIYFSDKYIYDRYNPDKSLDLLDEACAKVNIENSSCSKEYNDTYNKLLEIREKKERCIKENNFIEAKNLKNEENKYMTILNDMDLMMIDINNKEITVKDIAEVIETRTGIPVYEVLKEMDTTYYDDIIGQDNAKRKLNLLRKKIGLGYKNNYSILFCGSSGVGKTKMATQFGKSLGNILKLDMSEYMDASSINKILGAPPGYVGYDDNLNILEEIKNKPGCVLIVDEVEKAHPSIINLFLQILDDKKIKDNKGKIVRFDNIVIVFTSNIGFNKKSVGFSKKSISSIKEELKEHFSIPFINRLDEIILFNDLDKNDIEKIVRQRLDDLKKKYEDKIKIVINDDIISEIMSLADYESFGARGIEKIINSEIENCIIDSIIEGNKEIILTKSQIVLN